MANIYNGKTTNSKKLTKALYKKPREASQKALERKRRAYFSLLEELERIPENVVAICGLQTDKINRYHILLVSDKGITMLRFADFDGESYKKSGHFSAYASIPQYKRMDFIQKLDSSDDLYFISKAFDLQRRLKNKGLIFGDNLNVMNLDTYSFPIAYLDGKATAPKGVDLSSLDKMIAEQKTRDKNGLIERPHYTESNFEYYIDLEKKSINDLSAEEAVRMLLDFNYQNSKMKYGDNRDENFVQEVVKDLLSLDIPKEEKGDFKNFMTYYGH